MNDKEIVEYARKLIIANLNQYTDTANGVSIFAEIFRLQNDEENKVLLEHCIGIKELIEKTINIIKGKNES